MCRAESFDDFINKCWDNHDKNTLNVCEDLKNSLNLIDSPDKIPRYVQILLHAYTGHLGNWTSARELLHKIQNLSIFTSSLESHASQCLSVYRALAVVAYATEDKINFDRYLDLSTEECSDVRVYAMAANELTALGNIGKATEAFELALSRTPSNVSKDDPVARSLAISGNNLACELEEKVSRNEEEVALMITAATTARKFWEIAGG